MKKFLLISTFFFLVLCTSGSFGQSYEDHLMKGFMWFRLEDYHGAIKEFNLAIKFDSQKPGSYYLRGRSKAILEDYRGAILDFNKTIQLNPEFGDAYLDRGACKIKVGDKQSGCLDWSKAGELGVTQAYDAIKEVCN